MERSASAAAILKPEVYVERYAAAAILKPEVVYVERYAAAILKPRCTLRGLLSRQPLNLYYK